MVRAAEEVVGAARGRAGQQLGQQAHITPFSVAGVDVPLRCVVACEGLCHDSKCDNVCVR